MGVRQIITIDEDRCDGCGQCVPSCAEGALKIVGAKARLMSDVLCDGLGACLGECPQDALHVIDREAADFDEALAMGHPPRPDPVPSAGTAATGPRPVTALRQWPIQLHLVPPSAPFFERAHVLLAADCTAFAVADFHGAFLDGRALAIACPKLDQRQEAYLPKLRAMIDEAQIETLTVAVMEVPCCSGLLRLAQDAVASAGRRIPIKHVQIGVRGEILREEWI